MTQGSERGVLKDHKRVGRKLVPPLLAVMGNQYAPYSWARELVPEFLWIALFIDRCGFRNGVELARTLATAASEVCGREPRPMFARITSFNNLSDDEKHQLLEKIGASNRRSISNGIIDMDRLGINHPLNFFTAGGAVDVGPKEDFGELLQELYDRHSRASALTIATAFYLGVCQHKIKLPHGMGIRLRDEFQNIEDYPDTDGSQAAASFFRASAAMFLMGDEEAPQKSERADWLNHFWDRVGKHGPCIQQIEIDTGEPDVEDELGKIVFEFRKAAKIELKSRIKAWGFDLNRIECFEVVGSLLARQVSLAIEFALCPQAWTSNSAPLFLRAMADVYIVVAWILGDPENRSKKFVEDGLSTIKLEIAHRKAQIDTLDEDDKEGQLKYIDYLEMWMKTQRMDAFVEVNLGSWSGMSTRKMAMEAGCGDFYNYVYQPFSAPAHSGWSHISQYNSDFCQNPSHRFHRIPVVMEFEPDLHWLYLCGKYLQKVFAKFDEKTGVRISEVSAFQQLCDMLASEPEVNWEAGEAEIPSEAKT